MITFSQLVAESPESLGPPAQWEWKINTDTESTAKFDVEADTFLTYEVYFAREYHDPHIGVNNWHLAFSPIPSSVAHFADARGMRRGEIDPFGMLELAPGLAKIVLATVADIVKDFIKKKAPQEILFGGTGRGRQAVYRRLMRYVEGAIPGYRGLTIGWTFKIVKV